MAAKKKAVLAGSEADLSGGGADPSSGSDLKGGGGPKGGDKVKSAKPAVKNK